MSHFRKKNLKKKKMCQKDFKIITNSEFKIKCPIFKKKSEKQDVPKKFQNHQKLII